MMKECKTYKYQQLALAIQGNKQPGVRIPHFPQTPKERDFTNFRGSFFYGTYWEHN